MLLPFMFSNPFCIFPKILRCSSHTKGHAAGVSREVRGAVQEGYVFKYAEDKHYGQV